MFKNQGSAGSSSVEFELHRSDSIGRRFAQAAANIIGFPQQELVRHTHDEQGPLNAKDEWIRCTRDLLFPSRFANRADRKFS